MKQPAMHINGSDVTSLTPVNGVIHVAGIIRTPQDKVSIVWECDGASGRTVCDAWRGQYEIETICKSGYRILSVSLV